MTGLHLLSNKVPAGCRYCLTSKGKETVPFALARQRQRRLSLRKLQLYRGDPKLCGVSRTERVQ